MTACRKTQTSPAPTGRTIPTRYPDRARHDAESVRQIIDEALHCHLAFTVDGEPRLLPTLHARDGDTLYLHGSTGSGPMLAARTPEGMPACVAITLFDGLVLARSQFHHSANYRSVVIHGRARLVTDETEKRRALTALVEHMVPGRSADSRPPSAKELAQTAVLAMPLDESSAKIRMGNALDEPEDMALPHWAGVVPLRVVASPPEPAADNLAVTPPAYLEAYVNQRKP